MNQESNSSKIKRRDFFKNTALATGGMMAMPLVTNAMGSTPAPILKLAVVGCGGRGSGAVTQAMSADSDVQLVAMADAFQDRIDQSLAGIQEHFDGEKTVEVKKENQFTGFDAYKKAIDLADVVILATPPGFRPIHFEYAIQQGKHVFMEKPCATDAA